MTLNYEGKSRMSYAQTRGTSESKASSFYMLLPHLPTKPEATYLEFHTTPLGPLTHSHIKERSLAFKGCTEVGPNKEGCLRLMMSER